ncbi:IPT/TIG domain-containing protein [Streptomyces wuyuanensis]|uniref:IPT/TIG domain-containing protein n=1 Tax=Streptomyces wuyuanensis TaxID=1196353 RepID=UPI003718849B
MTTRQQTQQSFAAAAPTLSGLSPNQGPVAGGNSVTLTGTGFLGATSVLFGGTSASFTVVSSTQITATAPAGTEASVPVSVTGPDGTSGAVSYFYRGAPVLSGLSPGLGPTAGGNSVTIAGTGFLGATSVLFGGSSASFTVVSSTQITATAPAGAAGSVQVSVTGPGGTGNTLPYGYMAAPTLSGLSPNQGPTSGGNVVTLTGTALAGTTAVRFGSTPAAFTVVSATQVTATAPPGTTGGVQVSVTSPGGTSGGLSYQYRATPTLSAVTPGQGPTAGGNSVTLTGTGLSSTTAVRFGGTSAPFTVVSASQITATAPAGAEGSVQVSVTGHGGTSGGVTYFYRSAPVLSGVSPAQGPTAGGNSVTLTGNGLGGATAVRFGGTSAAFTVVSGTEITATAPAGSVGSVQVSVTGPGGGSNTLPYAYVGLPTLSALSPAEGPTSGGNVVTLTGTALGEVTSVLFGGVPAPFTVTSATQITATAPAGAAGGIQVTVSGPGGTSGGLTYTRVEPPGI